MGDVEVSLRKLQRLIAKTREEGTSGVVACNEDNSDDWNGKPIKLVSGRELGQQLENFEVKLLSERQLRETARRLHERAKRRYEKVRSEKKEFKSMTVLPRGCESSCDNIVELATVTASHQPSNLSVGSHSDGVKSRVEVVELGPGAQSYSGNGKTSRTRDLYAAVGDGHLLVNITDGSTRLNCENGGGDGVSEAAELYDEMSDAPLYSFVDVYKGDDRQRLLFIVDQLSHILRGERRQKKMLMQRVVPAMLRRIETLERTVTGLQNELTSLRERAACAAGLAASSDGSCDGNSGDILRNQVVTLLENYEGQVDWLVNHYMDKNK